MDLCLYALSAAFRPLVMLWESSAATYAEVDKAINPANITWDRVWEDVARLEDLASTEGVDIHQLCDLVFQKKLAEYHPTAMPQAWKMAVGFETPYQHDVGVDEEGEEDDDGEEDDESGARTSGDENPTGGSGTQGGMYHVHAVLSLVHVD